MTHDDENGVALPVGGVLPAGHRLHWYELGKVIGKGGFGITYGARDTNLNQPVAIKEYFPQSYAERDSTDSVRPNGEASEETFGWGLRRFLDEAQTLAKFRHPGIVRVSSVFEANGTAYMVMDYERGKSLSELIKAGFLDDEPKLLAALLPLMDGLEQVHAAGFIHRDIKPANIVIREDGSPVLLDFGAARQALGAENGQLTTVGTRSYAPFEQFDGSGELKQGPWTDIYSLGAVMYEIVSGERPAESLHRGTALLEGGKDPLRPIDRGELAERYSTELLRAIEHALAFKISDRPRSIAEWRSQNRILSAPSGESTTSSSSAAETDAETFPDFGAKVDVPGMRLGSQVASEAATEANPVIFSSLHALIVDDEPFVLNLAKRVLDRLGLKRVSTASDGQQALDKLDDEGRTPDVILCDLDMPGMDGLELLRRLGERETGCGIILVSGHDEGILKTAESLGEAHNLEILGALSKPLSPEPVGRLLAKLASSRTVRPRVVGISLPEHELNEALRGGDIFPVFQPKISVRDRKVAGVEALARLRHMEHGILGPGTFIPWAEECGRIDEVTEAIFKSAAAKVGAWLADGINLNLSFNVSTDSLGDVTFSNRVFDIAEAEGLPPSQVILEVTETRVMKDIRVSLEVLTRFRIKGTGLSIDDFGTGYSSLEQLRRAPFTELKIDRQFVAGASDDGPSRAILESSISLARRLNLQVVAEGVETQGDWDLVEEMGCDLAQGYFVAKPMSGDEIPDWIATWSAAS